MHDDEAYARQLAGGGSGGSSGSSSGGSSSGGGGGGSCSGRPKVRHILSVGQFRPEKDHPLQLRAFKALLVRREALASDRLAAAAAAVRDLEEAEAAAPGPHRSNAASAGTAAAALATAREALSAATAAAAGEAAVRLALLGSCRDEGDAARVAELKVLAEELGVGARVDFVLNVPFGGAGGLVDWLTSAEVSRGSRRSGVRCRCLRSLEVGEVAAEQRALMPRSPVRVCACHMCVLTRTRVFMCVCPNLLV